MSEERARKSVQDIFNNGVRHMAKQMRASTTTGNVSTSSNSCTYRGPNGLMCFIGASITDEAYNKSLEFNNVHDSDVVLALTESGHPLNTELDYKLLCVLEDMQRALHDDLARQFLVISQPQYLEKCRDFAEKHHLTMPEVENT